MARWLAQSLRVSASPQIDPQRLQRALQRATQALLAERTTEGHWVGELSSSALSTATAVTALAVVARESQISDFKSQIAAGLAWLAEHQNTDGGWGDTTRSLSNISTTTLCWAAFGTVAGADELHRVTVARAEDWLKQHAGGIAPDQLAPAIIARYGKDRTFSVPILTMCALAGRLGEGREAWRHVIPLPFELAACPHQLFAALRLPVVSYALPALIAIGQARHVRAPSRNPLARLLRNATREKTLKVLTAIQPSNGGFLEATPLTSFVTMSLAGSGQVNHPVTRRGADFLQKAQRADGSWPIDTNLATWVTTLAVNALGISNLKSQILNATIRPWLLAQQYRAVHPYTHAAPGGWAWTNLPGGVPDADDTAGAVLALKQLGPIDDATREAAFAGIEWLLGVQNRDGGIPTFCRGWGALPFDRSSADITAHAIRAWAAWWDMLPTSTGLSQRVKDAVSAALEFLFTRQRADGAWAPLWFGNQHAPDEVNLTYGTARVVQALLAPGTDCITILLKGRDSVPRAAQWLMNAQNADGGWGGGPSGSSVEETALAVEALAEVQGRTWRRHKFDVDSLAPAVARGVNWLLDRVESGAFTEPSPIGFYFAKLWYFERLYPLIFTLGALRKAAGVAATK